jgi:hypothetical protein
VVLVGRVQRERVQVYLVAVVVEREHPLTVAMLLVEQVVQEVPETLKVVTVQLVIWIQIPT